MPRVSILKPGGTVKMTSHDPMIHTMHAAAGDGRALFNVSLPLPNITVSRPIDRAGVVTLVVQHAHLDARLSATSPTSSRR